MPYAYKVKTLFDGSENAPVDGRFLLVEDGVIQDIVPWSAEPALEEKGYELVDYSDCFAMPGLIDGHVHMTLPGNGTAAEDFFACHSSGEVLLTAAQNIQTALASGITAMRDCGAIPDVAFDLRHAVERGILAGPDLVLCGSSLTVTGGHTHFFQGEVDTADEIVKKVRQLHKQGADFVKLIATGGGTRNVIQYAQMLTADQMKAACDEAHRLGKIATAHVCTTATARAAVHSGVDMLEHMIFADNGNKLEMDWQLAEEIAKKDIPVCITISVLPVTIHKLESLGRPMTPAEQAEHDMLCRFRDTIYEGFRATVGSMRYIPGTDAGWRSSAFHSLVECLVPMTELGMSNLRALHSATGLAAELLGIQNKTGTLQKGKQADFIILTESPMTSIRNLTKIKAVYKKGMRFTHRTCR